MYNPQRVLRQLGYDRGTVRANGDVSHLNALVAENKFVGEGGMEILNGADRHFARGWAGKS